MLMLFSPAFPEKPSNWKFLNHTGRSVGVIFRPIAFADVLSAAFIQYLLEYCVKFSPVVQVSVPGVLVFAGFVLCERVLPAAGRPRPSAGTLLGDTGGGLSLLF